MKKHWKISFAVLAFLALILGLSLLSVHLGSENDLAAYKKILLEKGARLKISEVMPQSVPADQNGADLVEAALKIFPGEWEDISNMPPMMQMIAPGKAMVGWKDLDFDFGGPGYDGFTNLWNSIALPAGSGRPVIELLQQAARFPCLDFQLPYEQGLDVRLPHIRMLVKKLHCLCELSVLDLHYGNPAGAATNICTTLALMQSWHDERTIYSQGMRLNILSYAADASWELLQATNVSEVDLTGLQNSWERVELIHAFKESLLMDRAALDDFLIRVREPQEYRRRMAATSWTASSAGEPLDVPQHLKNSLSAAKAQGAEAIWCQSLGYSIELQFLKDSQDVLETVSSMETNQFFQPAYSNLVDRIEQADAMQAAQFDARLGSFLNPDFDELAGVFAQERVHPINWLMKSEAARRMVMAAIALKRFQLKHGVFPQKLSGLVPEFVSSVPADAVNGRPLCYHPNADGTFRLYSVGEDGVDDGGDATEGKGRTAEYFDWQDYRSHCKDWVWPQPATAAEVEKYYADAAAKPK